ncbi:MAG: tetratricopeptide repeat protein [Paludibacteraceae bacterium]|nr:tetratricopeptide repeat protein [Paludibacteraceae bacterium]
MKTKYIILSGLFLALVFVGCSTKKNTATRRAYHAVTTKYNVYFNAYESYKKGYKKMEEAEKLDYSNVLNMYPESNSSTKGTAAGDMIRTKDKCEKAIKEHSIKKKPKKDVARMRDAKYASFYNQEEFNPKMDDVWMLYAKSKYYSNDYLAASAMFTYITKHFSEDKALVAEASIWKAKSMKEMAWFYEADDILQKVNMDVLDERLNNLYSGAWADLLIAQHEYAAALPYLKTTIATEKKKKNRQRFTFIAGQLYQELGDKENAYEMYEELLSSTTTYEMEFNAKIRQTEVYTDGENKNIIKSLEKMAKKSKNKDYLDQIYYAIGNVYMAKGDTASAIESYITSAKKSTRNGLEKAQTLITLGDIYYEKAEYFKAQPCYSEAVSIIDQTHNDYVRVSKLAPVLDELARDNATVELQDSLQLLAKAPRETRMAIINGVIKQLKEEEAARRKAEEQERLERERLGIEIDNMAVLDDRALGKQNKSTWYFANKTTVDKGKLEFQKKFGKRKLEDDWNRKNKTIAVFSEESLADASAEQQEEGEESNGLANNQPAMRGAVAPENDPMRPEYYLRQMPFTESQLAHSNEQIGNALFNMGVIYDEQLQDYPRAIAAFEEFARRFPQDPRIPDAYFYCYRIGGKMKNADTEMAYRDKLVAQYPDTKYAKILSDPNYRLKLERMLVIQDSIYQETYKSYLKGDYATVNANTAYMEANYPVSSLMPKYLLLRSLSIGKTGSRDSFSTSLKDLLARYPSSDVAPMAKDILALMTQGQSPTAGTPGSLSALREEQAQEEAAQNGVGERKLSANPATPYLFKLETDTAKVNSYRLQYMAAMYNFTKFLVKDFDLSVRNGVLTVSGLDDLEEALWYSNGIFEDDGIRGLLNGTEYKHYIISVENNDLIGLKYSMEEYDQFYNDSILAVRKNRRQSAGKAKVELVDMDQKALEDMTQQSTSLNVKEGEDLMKAKTTVPDQKKASEDKSDAAPKEETKVEPKAEKTAESKTPTEPAKQADAPKKELKKYKGLYTYDDEAPHYYVILAANSSKDDEVLEAVNAYNSSVNPLLNLKVNMEASSTFPRIYEVGVIPDATTAKKYILQVVKSNEIKTALSGVQYRNIVISKDNLEVLKQTGNINVYMELFKRIYLGR